MDEPDVEQPVARPQRKEPAQWDSADISYDQEP